MFISLDIILTGVETISKIKRKQDNKMNYIRFICQICLFLAVCVLLSSCSSPVRRKHFLIDSKRAIKEDVCDMEGTRPYSIF